MGELRIFSRTAEAFKSRQQAGRLLAEKLSEYRGKKAVVLGIPRGGIVVARELAYALEAEMDIVLAHKLRTPGHGELAMGSVSEDGKLFLNETVLREVGVSKAYIEKERELQLAELKRRSELIRRIRPKIPLRNRVVIVTDDGVATGATTQAAFWAVRTEQPQKLIAAIPVGPEDTIISLSKDVGEMVCLRTPPSFFAVGQFYAQFPEVEDEEVLEILQEEHEKSTVK